MAADTLDSDTVPEVERTAELQRLVLDVLAKRMAEYETTVEDDESLLHADLALRRKMAIEVRLGEKRILKKAIERVETWVTSPPAKRVKTA